MNTEVFWNKVYTAHQTRFANEDDPVLLEALRHFGDVSGAKLLDLGCGDGSTSLLKPRKVQLLKPLTYIGLEKTKWKIT